MLAPTSTPGIGTGTNISSLTFGGGVGGVCVCVGGGGGGVEKGVRDINVVIKRYFTMLSP